MITLAKSNTNEKIKYLNWKLKFTLVFLIFFIIIFLFNTLLWNIFKNWELLFLWFQIQSEHMFIFYWILITKNLKIFAIYFQENYIKVITIGSFILINFPSAFINPMGHTI